MADQKHEGWSNYATWGVALCIDNDATLLNIAVGLATDADQKMISRSRLADDLKEWIEADWDEQMEHVNFGLFFDLHRQLHGAAIASVDWKELADHYLAKAKDGA